MVSKCKAGMLALGLLLQVLTASAQINLGVSFDYGNPVTVEPETEWVKSPNMPSGSLFFQKEESLPEAWRVHYGVSLGLVGRSLKASDDFDTLSHVDYAGMYSSYPEFGTLFLSPHLALGREVHIGQRSLTLSLGGGVSFYKDIFEVSGRSGVVSNGEVYWIFSYQMKQRDTRVKGFTEVAVWYHFKHWASLGLRYRHHFSPALEGTYQLFHVPNPPSGNLSLNQRYLSLLLAVKFNQ